MWTSLGPGLTGRVPMTQHWWFFYIFFSVSLIVKDDFLFLIISQLHIKDSCCVTLVKIIQQWYIFTDILIPKDKLNLIFWCFKVCDKTYSEFERLSSVAPPASKLANVISLSKTYWWVQSCWVQCHKTHLLTTLLPTMFCNCPWCNAACFKMTSQSN